MPSTTRTGDHINRALTNPDPGVSEAYDYLGRSIGEGDTDFMGRQLATEDDQPQPGGSQLPAQFPITFGE